MKSGSGSGEIAKRYAAALYALADQEKLLDKVAADLKDLGAMLDNSADLRRMVGSPAMTRRLQTNALNELAERAGFVRLTRNFLGVIAHHRRFNLLREVVRAFQAELARRRGEATAEVVSAIELSDKQSERLADALKAMAGAKISVNVKVDPSILGGLVIRVGSTMIDSSLRTKLQRLHIAMKGVA